MYIEHKEKKLCFLNICQIHEHGTPFAKSDRQNNLLNLVDDDVDLLLEKETFSIFLWIDTSTNIEFVNIHNKKESL